MVSVSFFLAIELHDRSIFKSKCHRLSLLTNNNSEITEISIQQH